MGVLATPPPTCGGKPEGLCPSLSNSSSPPMTVQCRRSPVKMEKDVPSLVTCYQQLLQKDQAKPAETPTYKRREAIWARGQELGTAGSLAVWLR